MQTVILKAKTFDNLRKNYPLRREWQSYVFKIW